MDLKLIAVVVIAICGVVYFFPKVPRIVQIIAAIVGLLACGIVLMNAFGVPVHL